MSANTAKPEYPRPLFLREDLHTLNRVWQFEIDRGDPGIDRGARTRELEQEVLVPCAHEPRASGIKVLDFPRAVWYFRTVMIPSRGDDQAVLRHFDTVDHDVNVWVNDIEVARHRGGFSSFTASPDGVAAGAMGIWQTVCLEPAPPAHACSIPVVPQPSDDTFLVTADASRAADGLRLEVALRANEGEIATASARAGHVAPHLIASISADRRRLWGPAAPYLYELTAKLISADGVVDSADAYAEPRSTAIPGNRLLLNEEPVFQRLVLDQSYSPGTEMTPLDDAALQWDIELAMATDFDGACSHQKVFDERFSHHADRLGYLVCAEFGVGGLYGLGPVSDNQQSTASFVGQWLELVDRDPNRPLIVGWCPLKNIPELLQGRPTRLVDDALGYTDRVRGAGVSDSHADEQGLEAFLELQAGLADGRPGVNDNDNDNDNDGLSISVDYAGRPYFVSEYAGIWWNTELLAQEQGSLDDPHRDTTGDTASRSKALRPGMKGSPVSPVCASVIRTRATTASRSSLTRSRRRTAPTPPMVTPGSRLIVSEPCSQHQRPAGRNIL